MSGGELKMSGGRTEMSGEGMETSGGGPKMSGGIKCRRSPHEEKYSTLQHSVIANCQCNRTTKCFVVRRSLITHLHQS